MGASGSWGNQLRYHVTLTWHGVSDYISVCGALCGVPRQGDAVQGEEVYLGQSRICAISKVRAQFNRYKYWVVGLWNIEPM